MKELTDQELDELLRLEFADSVPDDGFSARVIGSLAPRELHRAWLPASAMLVGSLLAWITLLPSAVWRNASVELFSGNMGASYAVFCTMLLAVGLVGCVWALDETG